MSQNAVMGRWADLALKLAPQLEGGIPHPDPSRERLPWPRACDAAVVERWIELAVRLAAAPSEDRYANTSIRLERSLAAVYAAHVLERPPQCTEVHLVLESLLARLVSLRRDEEGEARGRRGGLPPVLRDFTEFLAERGHLPLKPDFKLPARRCPFADDWSALEAWLCVAYWERNATAHESPPVSSLLAPMMLILALAAWNEHALDAGLPPLPAATTAPIPIHRERELERALGTLERHGAVILVGAPGVGKSIIAAWLAEHWATRETVEQRRIAIKPNVATYEQVLGCFADAFDLANHHERAFAQWPAVIHIADHDPGLAGPPLAELLRQMRAHHPCSSRWIVEAHGWQPFDGLEDLRVEIAPLDDDAIHQILTQHPRGRDRADRQEVIRLARGNPAAAIARWTARKALVVETHRNQRVANLFRQLDDDEEGFVRRIAPLVADAPFGVDLETLGGVASEVGMSAERVPLILETIDRSGLGIILVPDPAVGFSGPFVESLDLALGNDPPDAVEPAEPGGDPRSLRRVTHELRHGRWSAYWSSSFSFTHHRTVESWWLRSGQRPATDGDRELRDLARARNDPGQRLDGPPSAEREPSVTAWIRTIAESSHLDAAVIIRELEELRRLVRSPEQEALVEIGLAHAELARGQHESAGVHLGRAEALHRSGALPRRSVAEVSLALELLRALHKKPGRAALGLRDDSRAVAGDVIERARTIASDLLDTARRAGNLRLAANALFYRTRIEVHWAARFPDLDLLPPKLAAEHDARLAFVELVVPARRTQALITRGRIYGYLLKRGGGLALGEIASLADQALLPYARAVEAALAASQRRHVSDTISYAGELIVAAARELLAHGEAGDGPAWAAVLLSLCERTLRMSADVGALITPDARRALGLAALMRAFLVDPDAVDWTLVAASLVAPEGRRGKDLESAVRAIERVVRAGAMLADPARSRAVAGRLGAALQAWCTVMRGRVNRVAGARRRRLGEALDRVIGFASDDAPASD